MKIEELEPWAQKMGLSPKHLILAKGSSVKWLVCLREVDEVLSQLIVYDEEGKAYASIESKDFKEAESFFENINIVRCKDFDGLIVNYIICGYIKKYDYIRPWEDPS